MIFLINNSNLKKSQYLSIAKVLIEYLQSVYLHPFLSKNMLTYKHKCEFRFDQSKIMYDHFDARLSEIKLLFIHKCFKKIYIEIFFT